MKAGVAFIARPFKCLKMKLTATAEAIAAGSSIRVTIPRKSLSDKKAARIEKEISSRGLGGLLL